MLRKLDNFIFMSLHLLLLGFLLYGCLIYAPNSPITLLLGVIAIFVVLGYISMAIFKLCDLKANRLIDKYYKI